MDFETRNRRTVHRGRTKRAGKLSGKCENDPRDRAPTTRAPITRDPTTRELITKDPIKRDPVEREIQRELVLLSVKKELREAGIIEKAEDESSEGED